MARHAPGATPAPLTPASDAATPPKAPAPRRRVAIFRWRGIIPLLIAAVLAVVGYQLFADRVVRETLEEAATKALGTEVDVAALRILEQETALELDGVQIADPFDHMRNLVEIAGVRLELEPDPLLQRKAVVRRLTIRRVRVGTARRVAAKPVDGGGLAPAALTAVREWRRQFDVPALKLATFDTVKSLALDPRQLGTVKSALALRERADSTKEALEAEFRALRLKETVDSARVVAERLAALTKREPREIGIAGARAAVADLRRAVDSVNAAKKRLEALHRDATAGIATLRNGVADLDSARRADYAFALGLLELPSFEAPEIGGALFGNVTIDRFQKLVYWTQLAETYIPPGLQPKETPGPERLRRSGTTVRFAAQRTYPDFLMRRADVDFALEGNALASGEYTLAVANVTTQPGIVGRPMEFALTRRGGTAGVKVDVRGASDRRTARPRDLVRAEAAAIPLPSFDLPGLPFHLDLNQGTSALAFSRSGDAIAGRWQVRADAVSWRADSARVRRANYLEGLVYRVVGGLKAVDLEARVDGTLAAPRLAVRSNLDRAIAEQLRAVLGEEIEKAKAMARAKVDAVVAVKAAEARERAEALRAVAETRLADAQSRLDAESQRLDAERTKLEARIKAMGGSALDLPGLPQVPKVTLPKLPSIPGRKPAARDTTVRADSGG